ncbi:MAG: fructose-bisphosphatase class III [Verrucomicrobia bacterium]|nr:fructose-bisphosphatase class III [Verrucomicrobiota bacterium]
MPTRFAPADLAGLRPLAREFRSPDAAGAEIARAAAELTLPKGAVHVISDIHGEDKKLRHIINNASGTLRPLVEQLFLHRLDPREFQQLLTLIFYPAEVVAQLERLLPTEAEQRTFAEPIMTRVFEIVRVLAARRSLRRTEQVFPSEYRELFAEILHAPAAERAPEFTAAIVATLARHGRLLHFLHLSCRVIRNLAVDELVIAGDAWDRGPRGDRVMDYLMQQPEVAFIWGNHDVAWLGACLGHEALICHVLRVSLRYGRLQQLEEGYGIPLQPLERLARTAYADDPADCFKSKTIGLREPVVVARMQKAAAILQFKLEGAMIDRHPEWEMGQRKLLHRIDQGAGTIEIDGVTRTLKDRHFPTVDPHDPYALSAAERECLDHLRASFVASERLWRQMRWMVGRGCMSLQREECLIFHGCLAVDEKGEFLPMPMAAGSFTGRELMGQIESSLYRLIEGQLGELDLCWYLWCGPRSPLFGKDRITTFENDLVTEKECHHETKNPYFALIHEGWFCDKVLAEFGLDPATGLIVNGHVPVKLEKGESPLKRSGKAITIDGAFSEAYGDHGFTLVLEAGRTLLAQHSHFESVEAALREGADIIPDITVLREWPAPKRVAQSQRGEELAASNAQLERLIEAYRTHALTS